MRSTLLAAVLAVLPVFAGCAAPVGAAGESTSATDEALALPADAGITPIKLPKCIAGPYMSSGFGDACPDRNAVAAALCSLGGFTGGQATSFSCSAIPGSIPQEYDYLISYECFRPQPCR